MIKIKPIIFSAALAFVFSFFTALFAKSGLPISLLKAVIFALVFGALAVGVQVVYGNFLADASAGAAAQEPTEEAAHAVGSKVDLVVSEADLPEDKDGPTFFVDGKHVLSSDDTERNVYAGGGAVKAEDKEQTLAAAEQVRDSKAAENIVKQAEERPQESETPPAPAREEAAPSFAPIDLASGGGSSAPQAKEEAKAPQAAASSQDDELDDLPDIGSFDGSSSSSAAQEEVIEDSEFAQEGTVQVKRQTELADGKIADVKDAPVMAEAIRTILKKEE